MHKYNCYVEAKFIFSKPEPRDGYIRLHGSWEELLCLIIPVSAVLHKYTVFFEKKKIYNKQNTEALLTP